MLVNEWLQIWSMHGILINYFTLWTTLGDLEKTIYMYIDIHGKLCAQWASTEETTHSTTHVQPHKTCTDKDFEPISLYLFVSLPPSLCLHLYFWLSFTPFDLSIILHRHNICGQICKKAVFKFYFNSL